MTFNPATRFAPGARRKYRNVVVWWCSHCDVPIDVQPCPRCGHAEGLIKFDSKRERATYGTRALMQAKGIISNLIRQPSYPITINMIRIGVYRADFSYNDSTGRPVVEDVKGKHTPLSKFKIRCVEAQYGVKVLITH